MQSVGIDAELPQPDPREITYSHQANRTAPNAQDFLTANSNRLFELSMLPSGGKTRFPFINAGVLAGECQTLIQLYLEQIDEQAHPDFFWQFIFNYQHRSTQFSLDEILRAIEQAQFQPDNYQRPLFLQFISESQPDRQSILRILFAVLRFLLRVCFTPRALFCGVSWSKRPWWLLHGSHPPKMSVSPRPSFGVA
jgi:hypothetical protein